MCFVFFFFYKDIEIIMNRPMFFRSGVFFTNNTPGNDSFNHNKFGEKITVLPERYRNFRRRQHAKSSSVLKKRKKRIIDNAIEEEKKQLEEEKQRSEEKQMSLLLHRKNQNISRVYASAQLQRNLSSRWGTLSANAYKRMSTIQNQVGQERRKIYKKFLCGEEEKKVLGKNNDIENCVGSKRSLPEEKVKENVEDISDMLQIEHSSEKEKE